MPHAWYFCSNEIVVISPHTYTYHAALLEKKKSIYTDPFVWDLIFPIVISLKIFWMSEGREKTTSIFFFFFWKTNYPKKFLKKQKHWLSKCGRENRHCLIKTSAHKLLNFAPYCRIHFRRLRAVIKKQTFTQTTLNSWWSSYLKNKINSWINL